MKKICAQVGICYFKLFVLKTILALDCQKQSFLCCFKSTYLSFFTCYAWVGMFNQNL